MLANTQHRCALLDMNFIQALLQKLGGQRDAQPRRTPLRVLLLDDDERRHEWFVQRFAGDKLDIAVEPTRAIELLNAHTYDAIFLDHDLLPEHYRTTNPNDDERTGYAVAAWLAARPEVQPSTTIIVHTRNANGA
ncbi:MAG TPA: cyclic-phosphate processing receiver domain-containing protein, partial [Pyrinomonadaceae bacterium]|nr:cyclic-phosphate processing receiver domain-containing protein [Pyrinomonadaceae bacterium]